MKSVLLASVLSIIVAGPPQLSAEQQQNPQTANKTSSSEEAGEQSASTSQLSGSWKEVSYEQPGQVQVMQELDDGRLKPVDVVWHLSPDNRRDQLTRAVLYGDTELSEGNLMLGSYRLDSSVSSKRITFDNGDYVIPGIFQFEGDDLVIALPYHRWNFALDAMEVGRRPNSFHTVAKDQEGGRGYKSPGPTAYRLQRRKTGQ